MLRNIQMAFNFIDKDMRKIITTMIRPKTRICRRNMVPAVEKACVEIKKNRELQLRWCQNWKT